MLNFRKYPSECGFPANSTVATAANKSVSAAQTANASGDFMTEVRATAKAEGCDIITAMKLVDKKNPQLRQDYIQAGIDKRDAAVEAARIAAIEKASNVDFMSVSRERAAKDKTSVTEAMRLTYKENPALHAKFIEDAVAKRQVRHYKPVPRYAVPVPV